MSKRPIDYITDTDQHFLRMAECLKGQKDELQVVETILADKPKLTSLTERLEAAKPMIVPTTEPAFRNQRIAFENCRRTVQKYWPVYWPLVEASLSAAATLRFKNIPAAIALFAIGDSGVGKNTVLKMFGWELPRLIVWRDKFSLASIQSAYGDEKDTKKLTDRALYKQVQHKLFIVPELALLFRGRSHVLEERFAELTQWLDGEGRISDSGTHGTLGEKGDFTFIWLAGTTPFYIDTWKTMAALGTRLLFFRVLKGPYLPDEEFAPALQACRETVNVFLDLFVPEGSIRKSDWPKTDTQIDQRIQEYASVLVLGHGYRTNLGGEADIRFPSPNHFRSRLGHLVRGRAAVYGREHVIEEDLVMARWITMSSMPAQRGPVLLALYEGKSEVDEIAKSTGLSVNTVTSNLQALIQTGVVDVEDPKLSGNAGRPPKTYRINDAMFRSFL